MPLKWDRDKVQPTYLVDFGSCSNVTVVIVASPYNCNFKSDNSIISKFIFYSA